VQQEIKFKAFLEFAAEELGATYIATGHYVRRDDSTGRPRLLRGLDTNKDQSYFLYPERSPGGSEPVPGRGSEKPEVRRIAEQLDLITAKKKDSTGICFIGERKFKDFLASSCPPSPVPSKPWTARSSASIRG
jgi:tRNA-specific 2-thiouridylase